MKFSNSFFSKLKPENCFLIISLFFGILILFTTPPFQVPDEFNHFYRAYQISEGKLIGLKQDNRVGGYIPESLIKISEPFKTLSWNINRETSIEQINECFNIQLEPEKKVFVDFPNTGMYSPISYLPQALSIFFLRILNPPPLYIFYFARIFTLLFWSVFIYFSIKILPFFKWLFTLIALLPMSLFINSSLSADVISNIFSFLIISYILKLIFNNQIITKKNFIFVCILSIFLASAKLVYTPILLLYILIPKENFLNTMNKYLQISILFVISLFTMIFWSKIMNNLYVPYSLYNSQFRDGITLTQCSDMYKQMENIFENLFRTIQIFVNSIFHAFDMWFNGYIGTFGWLDTNLPQFFIYFSYIFIIVIALFDGRKDIVINKYQKIIFGTSMIITVVLILLTQHLTWNCIGGNLITTIQGRYFIPAFPLIFLTLYNSKLVKTDLVIPLVILFSIFGSLLTLNTLYNRYYVINEFNTSTITCDAEKKSDNNSFETNSNEIFLENGNTQNSENPRTGNFSAKLNSVNQFAFTYRMYNCKIGDIVKVSVWRFGNEGNIIISGEDNEFYYAQSTAIEKDSIGWEFLVLQQTIKNNMKNKEIGIYIYYDGLDSAYFDDFKIEYQKTLN